MAPTHTFSVQGLPSEVPIWQQVNNNGFGDQDTAGVTALAAFNSYLYAGTSNSIDGAQILRSQDGVNWSPVTQPGFGIAHDISPPAILDLTVFNGYLFASTGRGDGPGQIWNTLNGVNWAPMVIHGFSDPDTVDITILVEFDGMLYAGATNLVSGAQVWRSYSGDNNTWTKVAPEIAGTTAASVTSMVVFAEGLYVAIESEAPAQIWRTFGGPWETVVSDGFGDSFTTSAGGMAEFGSYLYVGAGNEVDGAQLWRTQDGTNWQQAIDPGFGDPNNQKVEQVFVWQNLLYAGVLNMQTGMELWRTADGMLWEQANPDGFGDRNNSGSFSSHAAVEFTGGLYVGTSNTVNGGELWRWQPLQPPQRWDLYLPLLLRWP
jgi:hypothetical protein